MITLLVAAVMGAGLSAPLIGALSDALRPRLGGAALQWALLISLPVNGLAALACLYAAALPSRGRLQR